MIVAESQRPYQQKVKGTQERKMREIFVGYIKIKEKVNYIFSIL